MSNQENENPALIKGLGQIGLMVKGLNKSRRFFQDTLGLPLLLEAEHMLFFDLDNVRLMVGAQPNHEPQEKGTILYLRTTDIEKASNRIKENGNLVDQGPLAAHKDKDHTLWLAFFKDPDGNQLAFMEERPH